MPDVTVGVTIPGELLIARLLEFATELVKGQPPEVKQQLWQWYVEDMRRLRKLLKIDD